MKINRLILLFATCICFVQHSAFAMLEDPDRFGYLAVKMEACQKLPQLSLDNQLENVGRFVQKRTDERNPVRLVLGAQNFDTRRINDPSYIFFDLNSQDPEGPPHIIGDFNDLDLLSRIAQVMGPRLDLIVLDDSTYKFAHWTSKHIDFFASMLKDNGEFVFGPFFQCGFIMSSAVQFTVESFPYRENFDSSQDFPTTYMKPSPYSILFQKDPQKVAEKVAELMKLRHIEKYRAMFQWLNKSETTSAEGKEFEEAAFDFHEFHEIDPTLLLGTKEDELRECVNNILAQPEKEEIAMEITRKIEEEHVIPHIQRSLEKSFNVVACERKRPLPILSNWSASQDFLFTATKPRR